MKKRIATEGTGSANPNQYKPPKSKPKPYVESEIVNKIRRDRDYQLYLTDDEPTREYTRKRWGWSEVEMDRYLYSNGVDLDRLKDKYKV